MANKNKKSKALVDSSDDEPTSEFEVAPLLRSMQNDQPEIEVDAVTFDIEDHENEVSQRSKIQLKTDLKAKTARVEELEFEIEQISGKNRGLEEELKARIEIADTLHSEIAESQLRLEKSQKKIDEHDRDTAELQKSADSALADLHRFKSESDDFDATIKNLNSKIEKLQSELSDKKKQKDEHDRDTAKLQKSADSTLAEISRLKSKSDDYDAAIKSLKGKNEKLEGELSDKKKQIDEHDRDTAKLQKSADSTLAEINRLKSKSDDYDATIKSLKSKNEELEGELSDKKKQIVSLEKLQKKQAKQIQKPAKKKADKRQKELSRQLQQSQVEIAELKTYIDGRKDQWVAIDAEIEQAKRQLTESQSRTAELLTEIDERNEQLVRSREQYIAASDNLTKQKSHVRKLRKQNRDLDNALNRDAKETIAASQRRIEEQSGELQGLAQSLADTQRDRDQTAQYADELRMQLQDQVSGSKDFVALREKLEVGLENANATIKELTEQHQSAQAQNDELTEANRNLKEDFDQQMRQIRFELGAAEETIAGHQTINEQLVSDLFDNRSFQQALETQLGEVEQKSNQSVSELNAELKKARHDASELERNLRNKDSVISELMKELSDRSDSIELKDDSNSNLQKIDGFKTEVGETQIDNDRDRIARQLIGNADGKELRFPLFKNRLTIGRTAHNDIQLNMQYISRRHAVISSDHGQTRVIDWGSKNGVFVNNVQITEKMLESGDIVTIGTTDFRYEERSKR